MAVTGITLHASPVWICVTESTAESIGRLLRVITDCSACTRCVATSTGSMPLCGIAACAPRPVIVIVNSLLLAIIGPARTRELADLHPRPVVHSEHRVAGSLVEQAVVDHALCPGTPLLGGLEDEVHGAVEIAMLGQVLRGREQHRRVSVMAARVHAPVVARAVRELVVFLHRQRVDVGAQPDRALESPFLTTPTTPVRPRPRITGMPHCSSLAATRSAVRVSSKSKFGVGVDVAADVANFVLELDDVVDQVHGLVLQRRVPVTAHVPGQRQRGAGADFAGVVA